jgi:hypothetical protein
MACPIHVRLLATSRLAMTARSLTLWALSYGTSDPTEEGTASLFCTAFWKVNDTSRSRVRDDTTLKEYTNFTWHSSRLYLLSQFLILAYTVFPTFPAFVFFYYQSLSPALHNSIGLKYCTNTRTTQTCPQQQLGGYKGPGIDQALQEILMQRRCSLIYTQSRPLSRVLCPVYPC